HMRIIFLTANRIRPEPDRVHDQIRSSNRYFFRHDTPSFLSFYSFILFHIVRFLLFGQQPNRFSDIAALQFPNGVMVLDAWEKSLLCQRRKICSYTFLCSSCSVVSSKLSSSQSMRSSVISMKPHFSS